VLDKSKIDSLIQWQIIWQPEISQVTWRTFRDDQPSAAQTLKVNSAYVCQNQFIVKSMDDSEVPFPYSEKHAENVAAHIQKIMAWRMKPLDKALAGKVAEYTLKFSCSQKLAFSQ
jgi:hypothetical protein